MNHTIDVKPEARPAEFIMFTANCTGNAQNNYYPNECLIRNSEDLYNACKRDHVFAQFVENRRSTEGFIRSNVIQGDCDNDDSEDPEAWITPEKVALSFPDVCFYFVKSRNCDKVKHPGESNEHSARPRSHYYFPLHKPIESAEGVSAVMLCILEIFPEFDRNGMKPAQFFFGHANPVTDYHPGSMDIAEYFAAHPVSMNSEERSLPAARPERYQAAAGIDTDFAGKNIDSILSCLSADCDYDTWIKVGMAIKSAGLPFEIWDDWSKTAPGRYPGYRQMVSKWNSFKGSGTGFGSLVRMAQQYGWRADPENLTGEYKRNHDAAAARRSYAAGVDPETGEVIQGAASDPELSASSAENEALQLLTTAGYRGKIKWIDHPDGLIADMGKGPDGVSLLVLIRSKDSIREGWRDHESLVKHGVLLPAEGKRLARNPNQAAAPQQIAQGEPLTVCQAKPVQPAQRRKTAAEIAAESVKDYSGVEIEETEYLFFPWFPRKKLISVQGDSGTSKSTFMYAVGAKVTTGADLLGVPCEAPGNVMFITNEDTESDILLGFEDAGGDRAKLRRMDRDTIAHLDLSDGGTEILDCAIQQQQLKLIVLDPLQAFLRGDMNKANDTRPQLARLIDIAEKHDCCIVFIQHQGKDTTKSSLHRGVGSVDIGAATRSMLQAVVDPDDDNLRIVFTVKNNSTSAYDAAKAIRYRVKSRADGKVFSDGKRHHYHGFAEFEEIIPNYSERTYKRSLRKAQENEEREQQKEIDYEKDPLVSTILELIDQNPEGMFIGYGDLIRRITALKGICPYVQSKSGVNGLVPRINYLRELMMKKSGIQLDPSAHEIKFKPYRWNGAIVSQSDLTKERGVYISVVRPQGQDDKEPIEGRQVRMC